MSDDDLFGSDDEDEPTTTTTPAVAAVPTQVKNDNDLFGSESESDDDANSTTNNTSSSTSSSSSSSTSTSSSSSSSSSSTTKPVPPPPKARVVNVALRPITSFATADRIVDVVNPGPMFVNPHRFDKDLYNKEAEAKGFENAAGEAAPTRPDTVRWRYKPGTSIPESNARVVVWSDGSMSVAIGNNPMSVLSDVPTAPDQSFVYVKQIYDDGDGVDTCLECVGPVGRNMAVQSEVNADTAAVKVLGLEKSGGIAGGGYSSKRNVSNITSTTNPLVDKVARENEAEEALRAHKRQREGAAGMHRGSRAGLKRAQNKSWLEGSDDEDEYSHMKAKTLDEDDSDEDSDEDEMEMTLDEQRKQRQSRRTRTTRGEDSTAASNGTGDGEDGEDDDEEDSDEDDEDFVVVQPSNKEGEEGGSADATTGKKRKLEDDEDEDDEDEDDEEAPVAASSNKRSRKNAFDDDESEED
jgi:RNA polymerase-associated protein LEO1